MSPTNDWFKSSYSWDGSNCVEVRFTSTDIEVRDSKNPAGLTLTFGSRDWTAFLDNVPMPIG